MDMYPRNRWAREEMAEHEANRFQNDVLPEKLKRRQRQDEAREARKAQRQTGGAPRSWRQGVWTLLLCVLVAAALAVALYAVYTQAVLG